MRGGGTFEESPHWTHTERVYGGVALTSLDVRRLVAAAASRQRRPRWGRWGAAQLFRPAVWLGGVVERLCRGGRRGMPNGHAPGRASQDGAGRK